MPNDVVGLDGCSVKVVDQERVAAARAELLPEDEITRLTELFRLLGDPTRLRLLYALLEAGDVVEEARVLSDRPSMVLERPQLGGRDRRHQIGNVMGRLVASHLG